jgi:2-dehydropantoate 2-reductase
MPGAGAGSAGGKVKPELLIVGTGAMACLFSARLAPYARITHLGSWPEGVRALDGEGVRIRQPDGSVVCLPVRATAHPGDCAGIPNALVLVKSWQTERAASQLSDCLPAEGVALTLQNGKGNLEIMRRALGAKRAMMGVTTYGATLLEPGYVRAGGSGVIHLAHHPRSGQFVRLLKEAFHVEMVDDIQALVWGKLVINAAINPLTALLEVQNGKLLEFEDAKRLMSAAAEEAASIAGAAGVSLPYPDPAGQVDEVARKTAGNVSSMLQDVRRGAPTEIDAICGEIWREAERLDLDAPLARTLWHLVRAKVRTREVVD